MKRSKHSLSHYNMLTMDMGVLYPATWFEVLPGDSVQHAVSVFMRLNPMVKPVMHPVNVRVHNWFVPYRILWEEWEDFITGGPDGLNASSFPQIEFDDTTGAVKTLADYMGVPPPQAGNPLTVSAMPFRAYSLIFNEHYRDQDLVAELPVSVASGVDSTTNTTLQNVAWEKDYLSSARPWEQKGPSVTVPLGDKAFVAADNATTLGIQDGSGASTYSRMNVPTSFLQNTGDAGSTEANAMYADLTNASAVTVNVLREALALQRYEEARARYGSRYVEYLRYLGVRSSDARLQLPEYLGGGKNTISFSEILATAEGTGTVVGDLKGHGIAGMRSRRYRRFFEEHGLVMSLVSVRPKAMYMQALRREFSRLVKEDFWQKEFQHIGQQAVQNDEVYAYHSDPKGTWGYQDRYDEYRRRYSTAAGEFRTTLANQWHFGRDFASDPALNADFVNCVPTQRPFADQTNNVLQTITRHSIQARRMVTKVGTSFTY